MNRIVNVWKNIIISEQLTLEAQTLNLIYILGIICSLINLLIVYYRGESIYLTLAMVALILLLAVMLYWSNKYNKHSLCAWITIILVCNVLFPVASFFVGDVTSSKSVVFVLSTMIIVLLLKGGRRVVMLAIQMLIVFGCYYLDYHFGWAVKVTGYRLYADHLTSYLMASTTIGFIFVFQMNQNRKEQKKIEKINVSLNEALIEAQRANVAKRDFLSQMSHEIRTPINAITGMVYIAESTDSVTRKDYCLEKISDAAAHLLGVINDILDMSKIEAGKLEASYGEFDFEKMLRKVVDVMSFRIKEKSQDFRVYLDPNIPAILLSDEQRLAQIITNLLSNAVKFTPKQGKIFLGVYLTEDNELETGDYLIKVCVTDTGIGIRPDQQVNLFRSFQQADSGIARKFGGSGLGLAISKSIVEMLGGQVWLESEPGSGSTFSFTVKVRRGRDRIEPNPLSLHGLKALIVDDMPDMLEYFCEISRQIGLVCETAANGEDALTLMELAGGYDLYFIDWQMASMDGIELARRIKERATKKTVVIMISAWEWTAIESEAVAAGIDGFLSKPLFPSEVIECIQRILARQGSREAGSASQDPAVYFNGKRILLAEDAEINREILA
ncbi:MAG: response regulator, partial [Peptococcaceae bacterium]|nr:response regulator [Peptococcaceae bacterium]